MNEMTPADIAAVLKNEDGGFGNGNGWWIILLFLFLGWGNNGWGNNGGANGNMLYPWMNQQQSLFDLSSQMASCCCDNRLATANLAADVAREACANRTAMAEGVQAILDKMCDAELQAERRENDQLRTQLNMMNLAASQNAQTAAIIANNEAQTTALEQYLAPVPRPAYVVQNPNCCTPSFGCNCGM